MLKQIIKSIAAILIVLLITINTVVCPCAIFLVALLRYLTPVPSWRCILFRWMSVIPAIWGMINGWILLITTHGKWDLPSREELSRERWYLILCNHRSWFDIVVLTYVFGFHTPPFKFFMKKELLWSLPFGGLACWCLGFPLLHRHTAEQIKKNPSLKGRDIEITKEACQKFKVLPSTLINFVESTRFTPQKKARQSSPYTHLLKPRTGGLAITLSEMYDTLDSILDTTIYYDAKKVSLWSFLCGNVDKIIVRYKRIELTPDLKGDYYKDRPFRIHLQSWLNQLWEAKDQQLEQMIKEIQQ